MENEAISVRMKSMWFQVGVVDEAAAKCVMDARLKVVMNVSPVHEMSRFHVDGLDAKQL